MSLILILLSSFTFAQTNNSFTIHRVEEFHNQAVIATLEAETFHVGDEFAIDTPDGRCYTNVTQIITDYIYINTEQCQDQYVKKGTPVISTRKVAIEKNIQPQEIPLFTTASGETAAPQEEGFQNSPFFKQYISEKLSLSLSYLTGNALNGSAPLSASSTSEDWRGSNTLGLGADYNILMLPYNMSFSAGMSYNLPRSYGRFNLISNGAAQTVNFIDSPKLEALSIYSNLRYHFTNKTLAYVGLNHLFVKDSNLVGEMNGDFGFHAGVRHYAFEKFYAEGSLNFYNMNYVFNNTTSDFSLTELEVKAGYTF